MLFQRALLRTAKKRDVEWWTLDGHGRVRGDRSADA